MVNGKSKYLFIPLLLIDVLILFLSVLGSYFLNYQTLPNELAYDMFFLLAALVWISVVVSVKLYDIPRILRAEKVVFYLFKALLWFLLITTSITYFLFDAVLSRNFMVLQFFLFGTMMVFWNLFVYFQIKRLRLMGYNYRKIAFVGLNENAEKIIDKFLASPEYGYRIVALFTDSPSSKYHKSLYTDKLDKVFDFLKSNPIHHLMISLPAHRVDLINQLIFYGENNMIRTRVIPEFSEYLSQIFAIDYIENVPVMTLRKEPLESLSNKLIKRAFDILFSLTAFIFLFSWLFPLIALLIKLDSKGPVFFVQQRSGKEGKMFRCYKFRSMKVNEEKDTKQATRDDDRITVVGKFLREKSLDELPQFYNVLKGDMAVVGPRPLMLKHTHDYSKLVDKFMIRHFAKPGITGWAQINGFRGETIAVSDMKNRADADIWYIEKWNVLLDLKIISLTIWQILFTKDENAY